MVIEFSVNGMSRRVETDPRALLLDVLREELGLRGAKYGCGEGECGACTVLLNGQPVTACLITAGQAHGGQIVTVEAMARDAIGQRVVDGFVRAGAVQCGFCTPGLVLSARALLAQSPAPDAEQIRRGLSGNLCRCTGYTKIVEAVALARRDVSPPPSQLYASNGGRPRLSVSGQPEFARPATLDAALDLLAAPGAAWSPIAGGTDLLVRHEHHVKQLNLLDLGALDELRGIEETDDAVHIGALATYTDIVQSPALQRWAPALVMAAREVGGVQIQNLGTLAGNLVNASPAADGVPPLFVLEAQLVLRSVRGGRTVPVDQFATGPGRTVLARDELLTRISLPKRPGRGRWVTFFEKVGPRKAQTIAKASVAFSGWLDGGRWRSARIALGAVGPTVMLAARAAERLMAGPVDADGLEHAAQAAAAECSPIDDIRSTAAYRRKLVRGILIRNLWPDSA